MSKNCDLSLNFLNQLSVFETLRAYEGEFFRLDQHMERLEESCHSLSWQLPFNHASLRQMIDEWQKDCGWGNCLLRLGLHRAPDGQGALVGILRPFEKYPDALYAKGVVMKTSVIKRPFPKAENSQVKCTQYVAGVLAAIEDEERLARDQVFLNPNGTLAEGTVSNIFMMKQKRLLTPHVASGILRGVTRDLVIEIAKSFQLEVRENFYTRHDFWNADEAWMTNTSSEVLPVVALDGRSIGNGRVGPWSGQFLKEFRRLVQRQTKEKKSDSR